MIASEDLGRALVLKEKGERENSRFIFLAPSKTKEEEGLVANTEG